MAIASPFLSIINISFFHINAASPYHNTCYGIYELSLMNPLLPPIFFYIFAVLLRLSYKNAHTISTRQ